MTLQVPPHSATANAPEQVRRTYHTLDLLRGVAAVLVVLHHAEYVLGYAPVPNGYLAVDLFFVLSGFVISYAYDQRLASGLSVGKFTLIRIIRFWPLYFLGLSFGFMFEALLSLTHNSFAMPIRTVVAAYAAGLIFLPAFFHTRANALYPLNGVAWSLFFELVVNVLYAALFPLLKDKVLKYIAILSGIGFAVFALDRGSTNVGWIVPDIWPGLLRTIFSFTVGVYIYRRKITVFRVPVWLLVAAVAFFMSFPVSKGYENAFCLVFILIGSPLIVAAGASVDVRPKFIWVATLLGTMSYAIYAIHRPLLSFANTIGGRLESPPLLTYVVYFVLVCILCLALDRYFDVPLRQWLMARMGLTKSKLQSKTA